MAVDEYLTRLEPGSRFTLGEWNIIVVAVETDQAGDPTFVHVNARVGSSAIGNWYLPHLWALAIANLDRRRLRPRPGKGCTGPPDRQDRRGHVGSPLREAVLARREQAGARRGSSPASGVRGGQAKAVLLPGVRRFVRHAR